MRFIYIGWIKYLNIAEVISWVPTVHILLKVERADFFRFEQKTKEKKTKKQICLDQMLQGRFFCAHRTSAVIS